METQPYIVGKYYQVPTVRGYVYEILHDWPVIGPMHSDAEFIKFPWQHYHIDWRFLESRLMRQFVAPHKVHPAAIVLLTYKRQNENGLPDPVMKRLKCKREIEYPLEMPARHWLKALEDHYQDSRIKTPVCPHRGLPLDKLPCKHDGTVTCPGHGLTWNMKTGELVRYTEPKSSELERLTNAD